MKVIAEESRLTQATDSALRKMQAHFGPTPERFSWRSSEAKTHFTICPEAEEFLSRIANKAWIAQVSTLEAYYEPVQDGITVARRELWETSEAFYAAIFHELVHWTGHASRLNRLTLREYQTYKNEEELIAEIGSLILFHVFAVNSPSIEAGITGWISSYSQKLGSSPWTILELTRAAENAVRHLLQTAGYDLP